MEKMTLADLLHPIIKCKILHPDAVLPTRSHPTDAGHDLYTLHDVTLEPNSFTDVSTGVAIHIPNGYYWAEIAGRSSTVRRWKLQVQHGVIDAPYTGELFVGVWNLNAEPTFVPAKTRLAQVIIHVNPLSEWVIVDELPTTSRNDMGFGSSGI